VPYWTHEDEKTLTSMVQEDKPLEDICNVFRRSQEAIRLKIRRLGLTVPASQKEVKTTTTPQQTSSPLKPTEDLISADEALKMWLGCVKRLNEPGLTPLELKRIRLILSALRSYIVVSAEYVEKIQEIEERLDRLWDSMIDHYEIKLSTAKSEEEKARWQHKIDEMKAEKKNNEKSFTIWPRRLIRPSTQR